MMLIFGKNINKNAKQGKSSCRTNIGARKTILLAIVFLASISTLIMFQNVDASTGGTTAKLFIENQYTDLDWSTPDLEVYIYAEDELVDSYVLDTFMNWNGYGDEVFVEHTFPSYQLGDFSTFEFCLGWENAETMDCYEGENNPGVAPEYIYASLPE